MWYIILALYAIIAILAYVFVIRKWNKSTFEKVWFSIFWLPVFIAWLFHKFYNNIKN